MSNAAMWSVLIGFGCTVVGLFIGKALDRGYETRRWLRDERAKACIAYVKDFQELRQILRRLATLRDADPAGWEAARSARRAQWTTYNAALVNIELYGSVSVYSAAITVDTHLRELSVQVTRAPMTVDQWHSARRPVDQAMRTCVDAIRAELKLERLGERSAWVFASPSASEPVIESH